MHITEDAALDALRRAVESRGADYKDPNWATSVDGGCRYERDGGPSCIVGTALFYLGVLPEVLHAMDLAFDPVINGDGSAVLQTYGHTLEGEAVERFATAQHEQDSGHTWGHAYDAALLDHKEDREARSL